MKQSIKFLSLCIVMMFVFAGVSFAKTTNRTPSQKINLSTMQAKVLREGITLKDNVGNNRYVSLDTIKRCSNSADVWGCIWAMLYFVIDVQDLQVACMSVTQACAAALDRVEVTLENFLVQCGPYFAQETKLIRDHIKNKGIAKLEINSIWTKNLKQVV